MGFSTHRDKEKNYLDLTSCTLMETYNLVGLHWKIICIGIKLHLLLVI